MLLRFLGLWVVLLLLAGFLLSIPAVQTLVAHRVVERLHDRYGLDISLDRLAFYPSGKVEAGRLLVRDHHGDTLFYARSFRTRLLNPWGWRGKHYRLGHTVWEGGRLKIIRYKGEEKDNLEQWIDRIDSLTARGASESSGTFRMHIKRFRFDDFRFDLYNLNHSDKPLYGVRHLNATVEPAEIKGKNVMLTVRNMQFTDRYGLQFTGMRLHYTYTPTGMYFRQWEARTTDSHFRGDIDLKYTLADFKDFFNRVQWEGHLEGAMGGADLQKILSTYRFNPSDTLHWETNLSGPLNRLDLKNTRWYTDGGIRYDGEMTVFHLMETDSLGVRMYARNWEMSYDALQHFMPRLTARHIPALVKQAGRIRSSGLFAYYPGRLLTDMHTRTEAGRLIHRLRIDFGRDRPVYTGTLTMEDLDAGRLLQQPALGPLSGRLNITGKGFDKRSMNTHLQGRFDRFTYKDYSYRDIRVDGQIKKGKFNGRLDLNDPNMQLDFAGLIHFGPQTNVFSFKSHIRHADLYKTHWIRTDTLAVLKGDLDINMQGKTWQDMRGRMDITSLHYRNSTDVYWMKYFHLQTLLDRRGFRRIDLSSDRAVNGYVEGKFRYRDLKHIFRYALATLLPRYKNERNTGQNIRFSLLFDGNLLKLLHPKLGEVAQTALRGHIDEAKNYVHVELKSDHLVYDDVAFGGTRLILDNQNMIYNLYAKADSISTGDYTLERFQTIHLNINDTVYVKTKAFGGPARRDTLDLAFYYREREKGLWEARILPSSVTYYHTHWQADPAVYDERVHYDARRDSLSIHDIVFFSGPKKIAVNGFNTPRKRRIRVDLQRVDLNDLGPLIDPFTWRGTLNGQLVFGRKKKTVFYNGLFDIEDFYLNDQPLGHWKGDFQTLQNRLMFIRASGRRDGMPLVQTSGYLDLDKKEWDLNTTMDHFPVKVLQPFLEDIFDRLRGDVTGHFRMSGRWDDPVYEGALSLFGVGLRIIELNTDYQFDDNVLLRIKDNKFVLDHAPFTDVKYHTKGLLHGDIGFYQFKHWNFNLHISGDNLLALDTPYSEESLYYGTAFVKGGADITGDLNKIKIDAQISSRPRTKLYIQLIDVETVGEDDFIHFYSRREYQQLLTKHKRLLDRTYEGLELNMNLDITKDAEIEIVMDPEFGSVLHARGEGMILMQINTLGKFNMWGTYEVQEGYYDFKYAGIIEKKFEVEKGSTIVWNGDPYHAQLNIRAIYHIPAADITPLLRETVNVPRKVPVDVIINLTGDLMKPKIDFEIRLPQTNSLIRSQVEYALSDPDRRILQVLSLLYSKTFISEDILELSSRQAVEGNLSERVLSVFNSLLENDFFNVQLNYIPGRDNPETNIKTDTQVGLTVQTKVNKRIYINGKVVMPVGRYTATSVSGDIEAVMWLNNEGTLQLRIYNKRTPIEYAGQKEGYTQGGGLRFHVDFDTFGELLRKLGFRVGTEEKAR